ncbi:MAG: type IV pilus biogenesis protein EbsA [Cyanobacteria bacterium P01_E01_bin.6]
MSLDKLQPANQRDVNVYTPYYQGRKRSALPYAISLYKAGNLEGSRRIEGGESISFVATWNVSMLPADLTRCRIQFDGEAELSYEMTLANFEFIDFLIDVLFNVKTTRVTDFSQPFYRKLLRVDES